jgi:hypothetical protein
VSHPFDGIQEKLDRARVHLHALRDEMKDLDPSEFYANEIKRRPKGDKQGRVYADGYLHILKEPPLKLGVIAGDWAHNLRGALDHLVYQLAILDCGKKRPPEGTFFPIARTKAEYLDPGPCDMASLRERALAGVSETHRAPIDDAQPYVRHPTKSDAARHVLAALNAFTNADKHRVIQRAAVRPTHLGLGTSDSRVPVEAFPVDNLPVSIPDGTKVFTLRFPGTLSFDTEVDVEVEFVHQLGFGNRALLLSDLARMTFEIARYVNGFRVFWD